MLAACYTFALAVAASPQLEDLVTRLRAALLCGLSAGLGAVATGGLRLMDSRSALLGAMGSAFVLGVGVALDLAAAARGRVRETDLEALRAEMRAHTDGVHARLDELYVKVIGWNRQSFADKAAVERTGNVPASDALPPPRR